MADPDQTLPEETLPEEGLPELGGRPSGPAPAGPPEATLVVVEPADHGGRLELREGDRRSAGRGPENDLVIYHAKVSKVHFKLLRKAGRTILIDTSTNGVWLNGRKVETRKAELDAGAELTAGPFLLRYSEGAADEAAREATLDSGGVDDEPATMAGGALAGPIAVMPASAPAGPEPTPRKSTWSGRLLGWMRGKTGGSEHERRTLEDDLDGAKDEAKDGDEDAMRTKGA